MTTKEQGYKGKVKFVQEYRIEAGEKLLYTESFFREDGNLFKTIFYKRDGTVNFQSISTFDERGNAICDESFKDGKTTEQWLMQYNDKNQMIFMENFEFGKLCGTYKFVFDENGNCVEDLQYNEEGRLTERIVYTFDENGNEIEDKEYYENTLVKHVKRKFNAAGKMTHYEYRQPEDSQLHINKSSRTYYENGLKKEDRSTYWDEKGEIVSVHITRYDEQGNQIENINYKNPNEYHNHYTYRYTYDEKGNWVSREQYNFQKLLSSYNRTITYF